MSKSITEIARHPARFGALAAIAIAVAMLALFAASVDTQAVHNEGLLELDGNTVLDTGGLGVSPGSTNCPFVFENGAARDCISTPATYDWNNVCTNTAATNFIKKNASFTGESSCVQDFKILSTTGDNTYHTGSDKDYQDISGAEPVWHCSDIANATNKADLLNAYAVVASKTESGVAHEILYFGAERASENGTVFNGFWFLQDTVSVPNDCPGSTNFTGKHTCGDVLILFNYDNGGRIGKVGAWNWQPGLKGCDGVTGGTGLNADCPNPTAADTLDPLCLIRIAGSGDCRVENPQGLLGDLCGRVNGATNCSIAPPHEKTPTLDQDPPPCSGPGAINTPWAPGCASGTNCTGALASPTFSEGGVDLTGLGVPLPCISTFVAETRSSDSPTATLKDFSIGPFGVTCSGAMSTTVHNASHQEPTKFNSVPTVEAGSVVHDSGQLVLTGSSSITAGGTVTFTLYNNDACTPGTNNANVIGTPTVFNVSAAGGSTVTYDNVQPYTTVQGTNVSYRAVYSGDGSFGASTSPCEPLHVVDAQIDLSPLTAFNEVNHAHTITCTIQQDDSLPAGSPGDGANGFGPAPDGTTCTLSLLNNTAGAAFVNNVNSCTTTTGTCTVQINTSTAGSVDIHATTTFTVGGVSLTRATGTGGNNSADANKVYVDGKISLSPLTDTDPINDVHEITATVQQDDGLAANATGGDAVTGFGPAPDGTCVVFTLLNNTAGAVFTGPDDGSSCGGTSSNLDDCVISSGTCKIHITTGTAGSVDIHATATFSVLGVSLTRATGTGGNNSADANKIFVAAAIQILKRSTKTGIGGIPLLVKNPGAVFAVDGPDADTDPDFTVKDNNTPAPAGSKLDEDSTIGSICVSGLTPNVTYTVTEVSPPAGYGSGIVDDATPVAVQGTNCTTNPPTTANSAIFRDPPLFDIQVNFRDGGSGETSATIVCDDDNDPNTPFNPTSTTPATGWQTSSTYLNQPAPKIVVCTINVDP